MSRKSVLIVLLFFGISSIISCFRLPTVKGIIWIEGHITSDTTWSPVDTYRVINNTYVDPNVTLTILPGVHVQFADSFSLIINGTLNANGTDAQPVIFTSSRVTPSPGAWDSIKFQASVAERLLLRHVRVEYAVDGLKTQSLAPALIQESSFTNCSNSAIAVIGQSNIIIDDNLIEENENGIIADHSDHSGIEITNNTIISNHHNGIYIQSSDDIFNVTLSHNNVSFNNGTGISLYSGGDYDNADFHDLIFSSNTVTFNNGTGIDVTANCGGRSNFYRITFSFNNVSFNAGTGLNLDSWGGSYGSTVIGVCISSNVISSNNGAGINLFAKSTVDCEISDVAILSNLISSNGGIGVDLETYGYIYNTTVSSDTVVSNGGTGICMNARNSFYNVTFSSNTVSSNGMNGMDLEGWGMNTSYVHDLTFISNTIMSNRENGILLHNSVFALSSVQSYVYNILFLSNVVLSNGRTGMMVGSYDVWDKPVGSLHDVTFSSNTLSSNNAGGLYVAGAGGASPFDVVILSNTISANSQEGIRTDGEINANVSRNSMSYNEYGAFFTATKGTWVNYNDIYYNTYGINITDQVIVNAENNYWGDSSGPYQSSLNPEGKGNPVNGNGVDLDFIPFLTSSIYTINERPVAKLDVDNPNPNVNQIVTFDATNSTDDGRIDYYFFDFGDGTNSSWTTLPAVTHKYAEEGVYNATLIAMDDFGVTSLDGDLVYVEITVVPEFPSFLILPLFMIATLLAAIVYSKKTNKLQKLRQPHRS